MSIPQRSKLLLSLRQWKAKAITRREQVEALKKRQGELILSRETWKRTAQAHHDTIAELQATVKHLQAEVTSHQTHVTDCQAECCDLRTQVAELHAENRRFTPSAEAEKKRRPARYRHSIQTIQTLVALKLRTSSSFRAVAKSSHILQEYQTSSLETADPTTIIRWVRKLGYYALTRPKPVADDWIILLDHSVRLGAEKLCVILGLRESLLDLSRPLVYADLEPLWMSASAQWNGPFVRDVVERLQGRLGRIKYAVGDYGSDIRTGLRLAEIPHIHDVTHRIALSLKHVYVDDPIYREVSQRFARIRRHFWLTVAGPLLPPSQRTKSRYHNLRPLAAYGLHVLSYLDRPPSPTQHDGAFREAMAWIREYRGFFVELFEITSVICELERLVKHHGVSSETLDGCCQHLSRLSTSKGLHVKFDILVYFHMVLALPNMRETLLCTSDILESAFGKYKTYLSNNPMAGITDLALCIAAFTCSLAPDAITEALEHSRERDVAQWATLYLGPTLLQQRRQAFSELWQDEKRGGHDGVCYPGHAR